MEAPKVELVVLSELQPYEHNPKEHTEEQVKAIARAIKEFGFNVPLVITDTKEVVAGHGRLLASKLLKLKQVPCVVVDSLMPEQVRAYRIADNKVAESGWLMTELSHEVGWLTDQSFDVSVLGFPSDELDNIVSAIGSLSFLDEATKKPPPTGGLDRGSAEGDDTEHTARIAFVLHPEQRVLVLRAIKKAKEIVGSPKSIDALVHISEKFMEEVGGKTS